jgi:hypothetical protein
VSGHETELFIPRESVRSNARFSFSARKHSVIQPPPAPADSIYKLKPEQVETLRLWIEQGAKYEEHWTLGSKTAHGLTLSRENERDFLFITMTDGRVVKTTLDGDVLLEMNVPHMSGDYTATMPSRPP